METLKDAGLQIRGCCDSCHTCDWYPELYRSLQPIKCHNQTPERQKKQKEAKQHQELKPRKYTSTSRVDKIAGDNVSPTLVLKLKKYVRTSEGVNENSIHRAS